MTDTVLSASDRLRAASQRRRTMGVSAVQQSLVTPKAVESRPPPAPAPLPVRAIAQPDLFVPPKVTPARSSPKKTVKAPEERYAKALRTLNLPDHRHMLLCVPTGYSDCRSPREIVGDLPDGHRGLFWLRKTGHVEAMDGQKRLINLRGYNSIFEAPYKGFWSEVRQLRVQLIDASGTHLWLSVFDAWRLKEADPTAFVLIEGELQQFGPKRFIKSTSEPPLDVAGMVWVRYALPGAPNEADVRAMVRTAIADPLSAQTAAHALITGSLLAEARLLEIAASASGSKWETLPAFFKSLHSPEAPEEGQAAAVAARAMAVAGICNASRVASIRYPHPKAALHITDEAIESLIASQKETLTADQLVTVMGLARALRDPNPLNGLLSGDVGTGKTLAFAIPAVAAHLAGAQVAIVSPTEILANQVAANLARRFPGARIERVVAGGKIRDQGAILVGTSGLSTVARKSAYIPNFLIVDEQHKLSTKDRNLMAGAWTHQLEASATPIPRSLAATLFSGMKVFSLSQAPVAREIQSFLLPEQDRAEAVGWMKETLNAKGRVAIIYPRVSKAATAVDDDEKDANAADAPAVVNSVNAAAAALELKFPGRVGMLHGKMSAQDVTQTLDNYRAGIVSLVVASTIMETGIDIPDIRLLIVKDADHFGAAQLHQLRGRLARNGGRARFVMLVNDVLDLAPETLDRLETVRTTKDGFALAEADMAARGFGDLAGHTQTGSISCAFRLLKLELDDFQV